MRFVDNQQTNTGEIVWKRLTYLDSRSESLDGSDNDMVCALLRFGARLPTPHPRDAKFRGLRTNASPSLLPSLNSLFA